MEHNSDFLYDQVLTWLRQESSAPSSFDRARDEPPLRAKTEALDPSAMTEPNLELLADPLDLEEEDWMASSNFGESAQPDQSFDMGEIPIVQKRYQTLLKRRLQVEIERHPPLFPWETEITDYQPEYADEVGSPPAQSRQLWMPQLAAILPIDLPEKVLSTLLEACVEASSSLRPEGAKIVSAVKPLFPDRGATLNEMLQRFRLSPMLAPGRLAQGDRESQRQALAAILPDSYESATTNQQMAISLLAAYEILKTLALVLSVRQPRVERRWQTTAGMVLLHSEYCEQEDKTRSVRIGARLPKGGSLTVQTNQESTTAQRTYPGSLSVELFDWEPGQTYGVEIRLFAAQQMPLQFAIVPQ